MSFAISRHLSKGNNSMSRENALVVERNITRSCSLSLCVSKNPESFPVKLTGALDQRFSRLLVLVFVLSFILSVVKVIVGVFIMAFTNPNNPLTGLTNFVKKSTDPLSGMAPKSMETKAHHDEDEQGGSTAEDESACERLQCKCCKFWMKKYQRLENEIKELKEKIKGLEGRAGMNLTTEKK